MQTLLFPIEAGGLALERPIDDLTAVGLHLAPGLGARLALRLWSELGSGEAIFGASLEHLLALGVEAETASLLRSGRVRERARLELERMAAAGVRPLALGAAGYPQGLLDLPDPPLALFQRGEIRPEDHRAVAIVGARQASAYGIAQARRIAAELAEAGVTVVSGMARGIDAAAHQAALIAGGRSIAVWGTGLDRPYPARHAELARELAERGAVVSEYPLGTEPRHHHFPRRNRIISALARGVVVVEAAGRSGSLITAAWALDQGREVMALPGPADAPGSQGCHDLIRQGAHLVTGAAEVLALLEGGAYRPRDIPLSADEARLLDHLRRAPQPLDRILDGCGLPTGRALAALARLELSGLAVQGPGRMVWRGSEAGGP